MASRSGDPRAAAAGDGAAPERTRPRRGRPTREEAQALEERIRQAALDAFVSLGFDDTTMEAVASAAGVTKRTLYAKFPDKQALFAAVMPWALANMPVEDASDLPDDLEEALRALAHRILARLVEPHAVRLRRLALLESHHYPVELHEANGDLWRRSVTPIVDLLSEHAAAGTVVTDDLEADADLFLAMIAGGSTILADLGILRTPEEEQAHVRRAVRLFLSGALPR